MLLHNQQQAKIYTVGGKARGLFRLQHQGLPVPPFAVLPAELFDAALQHLPATEAAAAQRQQQLLQLPLPAATIAQIRSLLDSWHFPQQAVVVRSSIADEDGRQDAFPGIMDSFLNLKDMDAVLQAIACCAASAYSDRALAYRKAKHLTLAARPAVILQQQVQPQASGVLFTTFPDYPQELAVHATWGFGEGLVQGTTDADAFYFLKSSGLLHRQVLAQKEEQLLAAATGGLQKTRVAAGSQAIPCLAAAQLQQLYTIGTQLEKAFGHPQDIEFVQAGEALYLVQARPITQPIPEVIVYDNSNIQESYCGVTTPLTFSFARRAYATVYRQTMQVLGLPASTIRAQEAVVTQLLGLVKGRIYYNINNWYRGLQLLPSFRQNKADMERMMGLEEPVDFVADKEKTLPEKVRLLPRLLVNLSRLLWAFGRLRHSVPAFQARFRQQYDDFYQQQLSELETAELLRLKKRLDQELLQNWTIPIINDFYVMMMNGRVARRLRQAGIADTEAFLSRYLSGDHQLESVQPTRAMQALAHQAWPQQALRALILELPAHIHRQVQEQHPAFHAAVEAFISQYGDRTVGELKLETQTMRLQPLIFYQYLRNYLLSATAPEPAPESNTSLQAGAGAELQERLQHRGRLFRRQVHKRLRQLQQAIRYRESLRLERTRLFGMYRALYLRMGECLAAQGKLAAARDVFYLEEAEIIQALSAARDPATAALAASRRLAFGAYEKEDVPARVLLPSPPQKPAGPIVEAGGLLQGHGCFPGLVTGEVVVVLGPGSDLQVAGKIVCALRTDPGWAVLFPTCLGVLIEKGSSLSHSVILLRELGIPTIINVPGLTKRLQSGERVAMDGSTGEVKILT